jgi:hypothetical protein
MINKINNLQGGRSLTPVRLSINPNIGKPPRHVFEQKG